jgi:hypothetical protein
MSTTHLRYSPGHVLTAAAFIGSLALVLAAGLGALGLTDQADAAIAGLLRQALQQNGAFPNAVPAWGLWLGTVLLAYGLALAMLGVPGTWRRLVLWLSTLGLVAAWAPVLALAAHAPAVAAPLIATAWSGACVLVYAHSHRLPCEEDAP